MRTHVVVGEVEQRAVQPDEERDLRERGQAARERVDLVRVRVEGRG